MKDTILIIGSVVAGIIAIIGYILAIRSSKTKKRNDNLIDWELFARLNATSAIAIIIIIISCLVSFIF